MYTLRRQFYLAEHVFKVQSCAWQWDMHSVGAQFAFWWGYFLHKLCSLCDNLTLVSSQSDQQQKRKDCRGIQPYTVELPRGVVALHHKINFLLSCSVLFLHWTLTFTGLVLASKDIQANVCESVTLQQLRSYYQPFNSQTSDRRPIQTDFQWAAYQQST